MTTASRTTASLVADIERRFGPPPYATVVIATYNRPELLVKLLGAFEKQTLPDGSFEVVVVDDGSKEEVLPFTEGLGKRFVLRVARQKNGGAAMARQHGAELAKGHVLVFLDDDMQVDPDFVEAHLEKHVDDHTVNIGKLEPDARIEEMPLFERFYARMLARFADAAESGKEPVRGHHVYTGNLSVGRDLFLRAGGFDPSFKAIEDEELGIRFEKAGARFTFSSRAKSIHGSDKTSMQKWLERSFRDGIYSTRVGRKHKGHDEASPFRHLLRINPISKPLLAFSLAAPRAAAPIASAALRVAQGADRVGLEPLAIAGATLVYGMQFYRGVSEEIGGAGPALREYCEFSKGSALLAKDSAPRRAMIEAIREDHRMIVHYATKYDARDGGRGDGSEQAALEGGAGSLASSLVRKIGFQLMVSYRVMRFFRASGLGLAAQGCSRLIRHAYGSDIHWDCELEPGVVVVHGMGMALSYAAYVSSGSILFQHVTLGYGSDPDTKKAGGPRLERNVHVGIGATLFGPITVGESSKIMAGCVLNRSVPARSVVEAPIPRVVPRKSGI